MLGMPVVQLESFYSCQNHDIWFQVGLLEKQLTFLELSWMYKLSPVTGNLKSADFMFSKVKTIWCIQPKH